MKRIFSIAGFLGIILLAGTAGFLIATQRANSSRVPEAMSDLRLLNKAVLADLRKHFIINFKPLRERLEKIQQKYPQKTFLYFLYLNNGSWVGLNEREKFTAASMVKVPLAMATLKAVEQKKLRLDDVYTVTELELDGNFGVLYQSGADNSFSVQELLQIMLEHSDNTAKNALFSILARAGIADPLPDVYQFFGWSFDFGSTPDFNTIDLKTLSNMFIALYNAKYISPEYSNMILTFLAQTPFTNKIVAGIPAQIPVAHKIGVAANDQTFSDCGIVYEPDRHYILCLGSNGGNEQRAAEFMAEASRTVYDYVITH